MEDSKSRNALTTAAQSLSLVSVGSDKSAENKSPKTYKLLDGTVIDAKDKHNYSYAEIDHSEEDFEATARARNANKGKNIGAALSGFTR